MKTTKEENLKRQIEILRAQIKSQNYSKNIIKNNVTAASHSEVSNKSLDIKSIKRDIKVNMIFTVVAIVALVLLKVFESNWINLIKFI